MNNYFLTIVYIIITILFILFALYIIAPYFLKKLFWKFVYQQIKKTKKIYLTFDDGPDPTSTNKILEQLDKYKIKATFFVRGSQAIQHPQLIASIKKAGHAIGQHGYEHLHGWKTGPLKTWRDSLKADRVLKNLDIETNLYRPPYGKVNLIHIIYILMKRKKVIFWTLDPKDYQDSSPENIASMIKTSIVPGSVILLHDGRANIYNTKPEITCKALLELDDFLSLNAALFNVLS